MTDITQKHVDLVKLLIKLTDDGKISWAIPSDSVHPEAQVSNYYIFLKTSANADGANSVQIVMQNNSGEVIDKFSDDDVSELLNVAADIWYNKMLSLYKSAIRRANGADDALDEILFALKQEDDDVPF